MEHGCILFDTVHTPPRHALRTGLRATSTQPQSPLATLQLVKSRHCACTHVGCGLVEWCRMAPTSSTTSPSQSWWRCVWRMAYGVLRMRAHQGPIVRLVARPSNARSVTAVSHTHVHGCTHTRLSHCFPGAAPICLIAWCRRNMDCPTPKKQTTKLRKRERERKKSNQAAEAMPPVGEGPADLRLSCAIGCNTCNAPTLDITATLSSVRLNNCCILLDRGKNRCIARDNPACVKDTRILYFNYICLHCLLSSNTHQNTAPRFLTPHLPNITMPRCQ